MYVCIYVCVVVGSVHPVGGVYICIYKTICVYVYVCMYARKKRGGDLVVLL